MDGSEDKSYGTAIPKKSRSLDLKSLYKSKLTEETPKNLKRIGSSPADGDEKQNKRKKARKEVSLSSLENVDGSSKRALNEECHKGPDSVKQDLDELKLGASQRLSSSSGHNKVSFTVSADVVHIPKRKRNFVGRRKIDVGHASNLAEQSNCNISHASQVTKLSGDDLGRGVESSKVKQKKDVDEFKENKISDSNSVRHLKENGDRASHSVVNTGDSSLKKSKRKDKKQKALASERIRIAKEAEPLKASCKVSDDLQDDDEEENLEENAARMLSSRFDPSCTGFSSSSKSSTLPSANGLSFLLSSSQNVVNRRSKSRSGSESASVDTAGRILRPRKQYKEKGNSRKRRHFYEILLDDVDGHWVLNRRIKIFWPLDQSWYYGVVDNYDEENKLYHIKYDDRDVEWINLHNERFKLLLLRSEVPGNVKEERALTKTKSSDHQNRSKSRKEGQGSEMIKEDNSCGGSSMDSEPIISWLARSSHRLKSSPFNGIKKQKTSVTLPSSTSSLLYDEPATLKGDLSMNSLMGAKINLSSDIVSQDKLGDDFREKSSLLSATCAKDVKKPIVYSRRRFRHKPTEKQIIASASCSVTADHVVGRAENVDEPGNRRAEVAGPLWFTYNAGVSNFFWDMESAHIKFDLKFPMRLVLNDFFHSDNLWLLHAVLQLSYGTIMTKWPRVCLEMLFVDNVVGLRFLLFEGCLKVATALVFFVLRVFQQPAHQGKYVELQLPFTSIGFKFTSIDVIKKPLLFAFYNFSRVNNSKWVCLDSKLKRHCLLSKRLHLSECTYDNIRALQNRSSRFPVTSVSEPSSVKVTRKRRPGINFMGASKVSSQIDVHQSSQIDVHQSSDASGRKFPPFALSFAAAPTFFLCLHLKSLMEQSVAHVSFFGHGPTDDQEQEHSGLVTDDCSSIDDFSNRNSEILLRKDMMTTLSNGATDDGLSCAELVQDSERIGTLHLPEWQAHHSARESGSLPSSSSTHQNKAVGGSHSFIGDLSVQIPSVEQYEKPGDGDLHNAQHSPDFSWNINGGVIPSSNPTARRSSWLRNRNSSLSLGFQSHGWSDGKVDSLYNDFSSGPKKPRTQVSYSVPFAGYEFNSRNRSHHHRGLPHKRIRKATEKKSSDVARGPEKNFECLSCNANVLITLGDKGWRESGASVVLELFDNNEWRLSVKLLGITRYSYKAHQFLQPGSTNRYTHSMMWKGGKDWILEFPDRSQWALFKEMHEECYNRNIRAASVKNIPIPGVHMIEENDDNGPEVTFVRTCKYFRQIETDVEMALNPSHVLYDMDSEDEQWISNIRNSEKCDSGISEEVFEKTMDMFEKAAYSQQRDQFTPCEIEELMVNVGVPSCVVKIIYDHWQQRRQKKGMALIRNFQPPLWERYQQEVREWEVALAKNNTPSSNGSLDKVATLEKPPMFAFCLKPRGLESLNKGLKQRSQKRISVSGHTNSVPDQDGFHTVGRRLNSFASVDEKFVYPGHSYDSLDDSPLPQTSPRVFSPRDAGSMRSYSMSNDGYYRNHFPIFHRSKSKRLGSFMHHNDSEMIASYSQRMSASERRNGVSRWNMGNYDLPGHRQYLLEGPLRHGIEQLDVSGLDELRLRDASGAAQYALKRAKLKRDRAHRLLYRADVAIHKAVVALMTAEAMKASEDSVGDG